MTVALYKTTVIIWSRYDGTTRELSSLAREAEEGDAYCSSATSELVEDPSADPAWDGTEFFEEGRWFDDSIQFPRLLCEIVATQQIDLHELAESMDLTVAHVRELLKRADREWERAKGQLR